MIHTEFLQIPAGEKEIIIPPTVTTIRIEVKEGTVTAQGKMTKKSEEYYPLMGIASNNFEGKLAMTGRNLYMVEVTGLWSVKLTTSSPINIKLLY